MPSDGRFREEWGFSCLSVWCRTGTEWVALATEGYRTKVLWRLGQGLRTLSETGGVTLVAVVDDENSVRRALVRLVKSAGLSVQGLASAEELQGQEFERLGSG